MRLSVPALAGCLALCVPVSALHAETAPAACPAVSALTRLDAPLPRLATRLASGGPVTIVAIGSSSTAGAGATAPEFAYPSRLQARLAARFPSSHVTVVNRGINGQDAPEMLARFDTEVAPLAPALVIWQGGVNALFRTDGLATAGNLMREAIRRTRALGADFLLLDPQFAPRVIADADTAAMVALMSAVARDEGVPVFHRFAMMKSWHEDAGLSFASFLSADQFHMNDWSYDCLAADLTQALAANAMAQQRQADGGRKPVPAGRAVAIPASASAASTSPGSSIPAASAAASTTSAASARTASAPVAPAAVNARAIAPH